MNRWIRPICAAAGALLPPYFADREVVTVRPDPAAAPVPRSITRYPSAIADDWRPSGRHSAQHPDREATVVVRPGMIAMRREDMGRLIEQPMRFATGQQPREHAVACSACSELTLEYSGYCPSCQTRLVAAGLATR